MKRILGLFLLFLMSISFANATGAAARIWCFGTDGHTSIEVVSNLDCENAVSPQAQAETASNVEKHCGPCTDVAVASDTSISQSNIKAAHPKGKLVIPSPVLASIALIETDYTATKAIQLALDQQPQSSELVQLYTVVLLI